MLESLFFLETKLYEDICSAWIKVDLHSVNVSHANDGIHWQIYFFSIYIRGEGNVLFVTTEKPFQMVTMTANT